MLPVRYQDRIGRIALMYTASKYANDKRILFDEQIKPFIVPIF